jgi:hypothetical protein
MQRTGLLPLYLLLLLCSTCSNAFRVPGRGRNTLTATLSKVQPIHQQKLLFHQSSTRRRAVVAPPDVEPPKCPVTRLSLRLKSWIVSLWKVLTFPLVRTGVVLSDLAAFLS